MPTYLHFSDTAWFAKVHLLAEHKGKETVIDCTLKVIQLQEDVFVWTLSSVYSEELNINETFFGALNFAPSVHGTDFMGVRIHLSDTSWVNKVRVAQAKQSNFIDMLSMGTIKIKQVQSIKYHFLQIPNWVVSVDYTYRDSDNSGWLIDSLQPANDKQKQAYRREYRLN